MATKRKPVWLASMNLMGPHGMRPRRAAWNPACREYETTDDRSCCKLGLDDRTHYIGFSSRSKREVQVWLDGAAAMARLVHNVAHE